MEKWERMGAATSTLRQIAAYHLHAIDLLHLNMSHSITEEELLSAADQWASMERVVRIVLMDNMQESVSSILYVTG